MRGSFPPAASAGGGPAAGQPPATAIAAVTDWTTSALDRARAFSTHASPYVLATRLQKLKPRSRQKSAQLPETVQPVELVQRQSVALPHPVRVHHQHRLAPLRLHDSLLMIQVDARAPSDPREVQIAGLLMVDPPRGRLPLPLLR